MANVASITLNSQVYDPETVLTGEKSTWVNRSAVSFALTPRIFLGRKVSSAGQNSGKREITLIVKLPFASTASGADPHAALYTAIANCTFTLPNMTNQTDRVNFYAMAKAAIENGFIQTAIEDDEMPW